VNALGSGGGWGVGGNLEGWRGRPPVQVLPPADLANAGLEQSRADHLARAGSGGNRLPWIRADIAAPFSETHRLAVRAFGGSDGCGRDICGGSHWECRDHLVTARLHRSDGMSLRHAATKLSIDRGSCARAFDIQFHSLPFVATDVGAARTSFSEAPSRESIFGLAYNS